MEQIIFLDQTLLKLYGFTGIDDYKNEISIKDLKNTQHLEQINQHITTITELFKTGTLNLSRKNYQIDTETLSLALLRNLLQQANIPYEIVHKSYGNVTRLHWVSLTL